jgi:capsid protein
MTNRLMNKAGARKTQAQRLRAQRARTELAELREKETLARLRNGAARNLLSLHGSFEGGRSTRLRRRETRLAADSAHRDYASLDELWRNTEALLRNKTLARGMVSRLIDLVVGDGFALQVETDDDGWNGAAEACFNAWAERLDGTGADAQGLSTLDEMMADCVWAACAHGDRLILKLESGSLQAVEAPRIVNPGRRGNTDTLKNGVELDAVGRPLRFHIAPWDAHGTSVDASRTEARPADRAVFFQNPWQRKSVRGEPQLAASIARHDDLEEYELAVRAAARMAACYGIARYIENPAAFQNSLIGEAVAGEGGITGTEQREVEYAPGMEINLRPGEKIEQLRPEQPHVAYEQFVFCQAMMLGVDVGMPLFLSMLDARSVNLSSARALLNIVYRFFHRGQWALNVRGYREAYRHCIGGAIRRGELPFRADWERHSFIAPPAPMMDAKVEIEAGKLAIDARMKSPSRVAMELFGINFKRESARAAEDLKLLEKLGIPQVGLPGATPAGSARGEERPNKPEDEKPEGDGATEPEAGEKKPENSAAPKPAAPKPGTPKAADGAGGYLVGDKTLAADLTKGVAAKTVPADSAKAILTAMVKLSPEDAGAIIDPADSFEAPEAGGAGGTQSPGGADQGLPE